jgi:hypothetical protein
MKSLRQVAAVVEAEDQDRERMGRENIFTGLKDFHPKARTRIWSRLSYICREHSTAALHQGC